MNNLDKVTCNILINSIFPPKTKLFMFNGFNDSHSLKQLFVTTYQHNDVTGRHYKWILKETYIWHQFVNIAFPSIHSPNHMSFRLTGMLDAEYIILY